MTRTTLHCIYFDPVSPPTNCCMVSSFILTNVLFQMANLNRNELFDFLPHMLDDERTLLFQMPFYQKILMSLTISVSMLWGILVKCFIFYCISREKWMERPITILIILDQIIHLFFNLLIAIGMVVKV